jgi:hypothetical protein
MPDITMCDGKDCPLRLSCYRHNAEPTPHWQSYFVVAPFAEGKCDHFWHDSSRGTACVG